VEKTFVVVRTMPGPPRGSYPTDAFKGLNSLYFSSESLASAAKTAAAEALGMQTSKLSRPVGALQRELVVRLLNRARASRGGDVPLQSSRERGADVEHPR